MRIKKYKSNGKRVNRPIRIAITTIEIANIANVTEHNIHSLTSRGTLDLNNPDQFKRFWSLVRYLEWKGLRPKD